jgi:hypothetical protein
MGKTVDLGALLLQNEHVRAVGNMNVNARGDLLDGANQVIEQKNRQVQRQYQRTTTNVSSTVPVHSSTRVAKQSAAESKSDEFVEDDIFSELPQAVEPDPTPVPAPEPVVEEDVAAKGGLAAAIARSRLIKQEKELTPRERAQQQSIKKI